MKSQCLASTELTVWEEENGACDGWLGWPHNSANVLYATELYPEKSLSWQIFSIKKSLVILSPLFGLPTVY